MKRTFFLSVLFLIGTLGCRKDTTSIANNRWIFGGNTYTASQVTYSTDTTFGNFGELGAISITTSTNSITTATLGIIFEPPLVGISGKYLIDGSSNADPEASISCVVSTLTNGNIATGGTTYYNKKTNTYLQVVTNSNGKISASFPGKIWVYNAFDPNDSLQLSVGTITEQ